MKEPDITYRDDEVIKILHACNSIPELNKVLLLLGYLNNLGVQRIRGGIYKAIKIKEKHLIKILKNGRDFNGTN
jgi:hypothetical protein